MATDRNRTDASGFHPGALHELPSRYLHSAEHDTGYRHAPVGTTARTQGLAKERADKSKRLRLQGAALRFFGSRCLRRHGAMITTRAAVNSLSSQNPKTVSHPADRHARRRVALQMVLHQQPDVAPARQQRRAQAPVREQVRAGIFGQDADRAMGADQPADDADIVGDAARARQATGRETAFRGSHRDRPDSRRPPLRTRAAAGSMKYSRTSASSRS